MTLIAYLVLGITLVILGFVFFVKEKSQHQFIVMTIMLMLNSLLGAILALSYLGVLWPQTS